MGWLPRPFRAAHLRLGELGESAARRLLRAKGMRILACDCRLPPGELDIVALDGTTVVFVEVKTRARAGKFRPSSGLSFAQMRRNVGAGKYYLKMIGSPRLTYRFDLVEVLHDFRRVRAIYHHRHYYGSGESPR